MAKGHAFQAPTGTRDFYPQDMLRRRYIEKMWRDTSIRHGFEEIDGPTFEHLDLYTVKSGEGIINELFSFKRAGGEKDYALRPEFTPTLARMYAAKAGGLAKPTKWFTTGPFFRAERPQRGRLRKFLQWNVDFIGGEDTAEAKAEADAEALACCVSMLEAAGFTRDDVQIHVNDRWFLNDLLRGLDVREDLVPKAFEVIDQVGKKPIDALRESARQSGILTDGFSKLLGSPLQPVNLHGRTELLGFSDYFSRFSALKDKLERAGLAGWFKVNMLIARGLAYYTGMVFEAVAGGQRAVCGGGRYDNLIELFGGPPTPAVGFGMGDVVLSLVLQDKGLMPEGAALMDKLSEPPASPRPDIFVIANDQPESAAALRPLVATLRRGSATVRPLHARHSYKATKNIGKLLQEASACHSRFAAILESGSEATLKNLTTGEQTAKVAIADIAARVSGTHS